MKKLALAVVAAAALAAGLSNASAAAYSCSWVQTPYGLQQVCNWVPTYSCTTVQTPYGLQQSCGYN